MAANIEQIFQDFILNKIREIEDQNEDKIAAEGSGDVNNMAEAEKAPSERNIPKELKAGGSQKKHRKHKKHKSKKKRRNREKESSSESGAELEEGTKHQPRGGSPTELNKERGEVDESKSICNKRYSTEKRKKKKRRRKGEENSSDCKTEFVLKQRESKSGQCSLPRRREDLPDIIPKQDSSNKGGGDEKRRSRRRIRSCSRSRSHSRSHSCLVRRNSKPRNHPRRSRTRSSSSDKRGTLDESTQSPSEGLQLSQVIAAEELPESRTEPQSQDQRAKPLQNQENSAPRLAAGSVAPQSILKQSISTEPDQNTEPSPPQLRASNCTRSSDSNVKSPANKRKKSPQRKKEAKRPRQKSPCRSHRRGSRSRSHSKKKRSRSRSGGRRSRRSRSRSASHGRRRPTYSQRDRWKREPSHSPVLILRKNRSPTRKLCSLSNSPQRVSELGQMK